MALVPTTAESWELGVIGRMNEAFGTRFLPAAFLAVFFAGALFAAGRFFAADFFAVDFFAALRGAGLLAALFFAADFFFAGIDGLRVSERDPTFMSARTKLNAPPREARCS